MTGNQCTLDEGSWNQGAVLRVSEISRIIAALLEDDRLRGVWVSGEVTNYKRHDMSGHRYFSLSEKSGGTSAVLNCVMWRTGAAKLTFEPADGMNVMAFGDIGHYAPQGKYQFYVKELRQAGLGEKYLLVERWKRELEAEGVFAPERKVRLPPFPRRVGVVTSGTGAVLHDIRNVIARRYPVEIVLSPTAVQGDGAHQEITDAIRRIDGCVDVIIIARGGGSFEDLFPFNHPDVVRTIASCRTPVISAIGHEVDVTLADFAADIRAPTPSAAAELAVPDRAALFEELSASRRKMRGQIEARLVRACETVRDLRERLHPRKILRKIADRREYADSLVEQLGRSYRSRLERERLGIGRLSAIIEGYNPVRTLERGYCLAVRNGGIVRSAGLIKPDDSLSLKFSDGSAEVNVRKVKYGKDV
ncbi:MAG: exodeoxyribonuclease VII large subunit [Methanoregulaceae archaeon]|nr:exodeoxyribonuclease VII large subunit [Methanoregulaceae archaeon]